MYKNVNTVSDGFSTHATDAVVIDDVIIIGRRRVYCECTLLGRCICKCVDVYIITLSCTWRIYALSEVLIFFLSLSFRSKHDIHLVFVANGIARLLHDVIG